MKLKKHEVLPMGFGLSTGGEYRIPNNNPPQRTHDVLMGRSPVKPPRLCIVHLGAQMQLFQNGFKRKLHLETLCFKIWPWLRREFLETSIPWWFPSKFWPRHELGMSLSFDCTCSAWNLLLSFIIIVVDEFLFLSGEMNQIPIIFSAVHDFARLIVKVPDSKLLNPNLRRVAPPGPKSWGFRRPWAPRAGRRRWSTGSLRTTDACRIPQGAFAGKGWRGWGFFWAEIAESILKVDVCWCMLIWFDLICYDFLILLRQISEQIQRNTKDRSVAVEGLGDAVVKEGHNWQVLVLVWGCLYFPESCYCTSTKHLGHLGQTRELLKFREDTSFEKCWHEQAIQ